MHGKISCRDEVDSCAKCKNKCELGMEEVPNKEPSRLENMAAMLNPENWADTMKDTKHLRLSQEEKDILRHQFMDMWKPENWVVPANTCPECGVEMINEGGCVTCKNCGYSKCD